MNIASSVLLVRRYSFEPNLCKNKNVFPTVVTHKSVDMRKVFLVLVLLCGQWLTVVAQGNTDPRIAEVYGDFAGQLSQEQIAWLKTKLERSSVSKEPVTPAETYPKLSTLPVVNKYVPALQKETVFDVSHINPLKYRIDFYNTKKDLVYRIDGTDYVLIIKRKDK